MLPAAANGEWEWPGGTPDPGRRTASPCTPCSTVFSFFISCYGKFQTNALLNAMSIEVCGKLLATRPIAPEGYVLSLALATKCLFMNKEILPSRAITLSKLVWFKPVLIAKLRPKASDLLCWGSMATLRA